MVSAALVRALETIERRGQDLRSLFESGVQPNYDDGLRSGRIERTNDPLAIVLPEEAYLIAGDPNRPAYSRDGALQLRDGTLVTADGTPVLGFAGGEQNGMPQPLAIERRDALLGRASDIRIEPDGIFGYARTIVDPQTLESNVERVSVGRLALARFPAGSRPERIDSSHARAPAGIVPFVGSPADGTFSGLAVRSRAIGRLDPDTTISRLQDAYLAALSLCAAERTRYWMARDAFDLVK